MAAVHHLRPPSQDQLVLAALDGDEAAIEVLVRELNDPLTAYAARRAPLTPKE